ncbi:hypothetical protein LTR70_006026 [Exophiala xenobiotica]|uniref:Uncharacterized protein n=1 Tax=Lithohypha guttulata TaxID=1690604 RepID=A0ABR0KAV6_9EURO|nr:hypothetical protein LTR24_004782 [Lithohypha guttulata]KAK5316995.1 hypothetical protein LTR70_006026 [Exophiala xenobiotica]
MFVGAGSLITSRITSRSLPGLSPSPTAALDVLQLDPDESRAFDYFLHRAAPCLAATQDGSFWTSLVPQVVRQHAAVRNAVLAISCMFEHPPETSNPVRAASVITKAQSQALKWQSRSIKGFYTSLSQSQDKEQTELALLSCVLLTTIEFQQNNVHNAIMLLKHGYDMASNIFTSSANSIPSTIKGILVPILARQTVLMATFGRLPPKHWFERFQSIAPTSVSELRSLTDARAGLYTCLFKGMEVVYAANSAYMEDSAPDLGPMGPLKSQQAAVMAELAQWDKAFFLFSQSRSGKFTEKEQLASTSMIMYYNIACIWILTMFDATETILQDKQTHRFQTVVDCAETLLDAAQKGSQETPAPFSFEMGVIPPLFFTGSRCRHPLIRRKTVELLRRAPKQEALYAAEMNARAIERLLEIEEDEDLTKSVAEGTCQGAWPSRETVCDHASILYELDGGKKFLPSLSYIRGYSRGEDGKPRFERATVPLY